jgi:hypothetical protein
MLTFIFEDGIDPENTTILQKVSNKLELNVVSSAPRDVRESKSQL